MSERYAFTNTYDIVLAMHKRGYRVSSVMGGKRNYNKVMIRMRSPDYGEHDGAIPELVVLDSHDGSSRLKTALGALTVACLNGMIAADMLYSRSYLHHARDLQAQMMLDMDDVDDAVKKLRIAIRNMRRYQTSFAERLLVADSAIKQRWGEDRDGSFVADLRQKMLRIRRDEDNNNDLYTVMNVVQENILRGGGSYVVNDRLQHIRPINAVDRNVTINQQLWQVAEDIMKKRAA